MTARCHYAGTDQPRMLTEHLRDCDSSGCDGCKPCPERHCTLAGCPGRHLSDSEALACARCIGTVRDDLKQILALCGDLPEEAVERGINSEAAMLAGPVADYEAWQHRARSAIFGRVSDAYLEDCRDELHPLWVLGGWDMLWREHLDHDRLSDVPLTLTAAGAYLGQQLAYMAQQPEPDFDQFAREIRQCRGHLEDVLRDGIRLDKGAPCPMCGRGALVKDYGTSEDEDRWACPRCAASYTETDYRSKVAAVYVLHAEALTASQIAATYRVPEGTVRRWASKEQIRKRGKDDRTGLTLYDVGDVLRMREAPAGATA